MAEEKTLENRIKKYLKNEGCWYIKYWAGGGFTKSGIPDLLICCNGHFIGAEIKGSDGKPTVLQIRQLVKIRRAGGIGILIYPKDEAVFKELIRALMDKNRTEVRRIRLLLEERVETRRCRFDHIGHAPASGAHGLRPGPGPGQRGLPPIHTISVQL